jgi:hypothetical protein
VRYRERERERERDGGGGGGGGVAVQEEYSGLIFEKKIARHISY